MLPHQLLKFCAAAPNCTRRSAAAVSAGHGDNDVILLAVNASRVGSFFKRVDRQQAFHEDLEKLDKTAEFLHGNDQPVVFLAEVLLHELSGFPVHQFALGAIGAALRFRRF